MRKYGGKGSGGRGNYILLFAHGNREMKGEEENLERSSFFSLCLMLTMRYVVHCLISEDNSIRKTLTSIEVLTYAGRKTSESGLLLLKIQKGTEFWRFKVRRYELNLTSV